MKIFTRAMATLLAASALGANVAAAQDDPDLSAYASTAGLTATAQNVTVSFLYAIASSDNALYLFSSVGVPAVMLIDVPGTGVPPSSGTGVPLSVTFDITDYGFNIGDELIFALCTDNIGGGGGCDAPFNSAWYIGDSDHSAVMSAAVWNGFGYGNTAAAGSTVVGFENRAVGDPYWDNDYNDLVFSFENVSAVPEPATMGLLAFGLVGLGGAGLVRRRNRVS